MALSRHIVTSRFATFERELRHLGAQPAFDLPEWKSSLAKLRLHRRSLVAGFGSMERGEKITAFQFLAFQQAYFSVVAIELLLLGVPPDSPIDRRLVEIAQERTNELLATLELVVTDYDAAVRGVLVKRAQRRQDFDPAHAN